MRVIPFLKARFLATLLFANILFAQSFSVSKIEPANWWCNMKYNKIQIMVYGSELYDISAVFNSKDLKVTKVHTTANSSYAFIDVTVAPRTKPGNYTLTVKSQNGKMEINFPVLKREPSAGRHNGFDMSDVIYMITPDRFADGDPSNNDINGMNDGYDANSSSSRHGGDIQGIISHLAYIKELGCSAIWINPLIENNTRLSYHGYGATDLYKIDPRFGTNELYSELVREAHKLGLKIIMDHVANHISSFHPWMKNLPSTDWLNGSQANHSNNFHEKISLVDMHGAAESRENIIHGWFVDEMPDLNQCNPYLANYLIQNTIWWIETSGIDGIREDTYVYPDQKFIAEWAKTIMDEYPKFNIVGEVWTGVPATLAAWQKGSKFARDFKTELPCVTDFAFLEAFKLMFNEGKSITELYTVLGQDFLYPDPDNLLTFVDNHDVERLMFLAKKDVRKFKLAIAILLTSRGIPQLYYGDELGIYGGAEHGLIRADFPGGFANKTRDAFSQSGRTEAENDIWDYIHNILKARKENPALSKGSLVQFQPRKEIYIYFKTADKEKVMVVVNYNATEKMADLNQAGGQLKGFAKAKDLLTGNIIPLNDMKLKMQPFEVAILRLE